ncbi:MAG: methyltransferase domain protein [Nocardioides sp.]|nr:methyltransferase domain protein [Nocardioides sp.]
MTYINRDYWGAWHGRGDLRAVGQTGLPVAANAWIYRCIERNLRGFARRHGLHEGGGRRMLEIGVGTGYWIDLWESLGWQVDGCDLVPEAVRRLRRSRPRGHFWRADVSRPAGVLLTSRGAAEEGYDLVTVTSVLLHVTRPQAFRRALANAAAAVRPGGHLLLVEPVLTLRARQDPYDPAKHSRARVLRSYVGPLRQHGLELVALEATTVLAANPLEARSPRRLRMYERWWRLVRSTRARPWLLKGLGPAMYVGDGLLMRTGEAPTSKVLLFRKKGADARPE